MDIIEIIERKKNKRELTAGEIDFFINGLLNGTVKDYQASALLMAVCINGMTDTETKALTRAMTGKRIDLSEIDGVKADKHSSGGVGDKVTIAIAPIVAECGVKLPKMSGRGLGHTGGTIDKLSSIPGFKTDLTRSEIVRITNEAGCCISAQTDDIAPADKILYALRDVTGTVGSIPLIASSIMSKKIASGCDVLSLDVKCGSGALIKTTEDAERLARLMTIIGNDAGIRTRVHINDMNEPLGCFVGNALEVIEVIEFLKGNASEPKMKELFISTAADILDLAGIENPRDKAIDAVKSGRALARFKKWIAAQGANAEITEDYSLFGKAEYSADVMCMTEGEVVKIDCARIGHISVLLGAGRLSKENCIDYTAGIQIHKKLGDRVSAGEPLATIYTSKKDIYHDAAKGILESYHFNVS